MKSAKNLIATNQLIACIGIAAIGLAYFFYSNKPDQQYYVRSQTNELRRIYPLDQPNISTDALLRWGSLAATNAYTLDFVNYESSLASVRKFFTKAGYASFEQALSSVNRLQDIIEQKLIVSAVVYSPPVIVNEGKFKGFYSWELQIPLLLTYQGASLQSTKQNLIVTMLITRVPTSIAASGIGIAKIEDRNTSAR